jgi:LAS superfamily LD-carboxypeptidase LdcB
MNAAELTGQARSHIAEIAEPPCLLHVDAVTPFKGLRRAAEGAGFDLVAISSFRDFEQQLAIWNGKFNGERPLNDATACRSRRRVSRRISASMRFCCGRHCRERAGIIGGRTWT